jgi:hypothetical protein
MTPDLFRQLVGEARFSPSVHNVQPTRWRLEPDGTVLVIDAPGRRLTVGDPTGRDALASHGAAVEGFAIAASARGLCVEVSGHPGAVARLRFREGAPPDPLHPFLATRRTYRGKFGPGAPPVALPGLRLVTEAVDRVAEVADAASLRTFRDRAFRAELLSWMRLTRGHRDWARDGLNAEALAMSRLEAAGAAVVLRAGVFEALDRLGLGGALTAEADVVRTSAALAVLDAPLQEPPFDTGRRWHRAWLEIARVGLSAAPMTVLGDDPAAAAEIGSLAGVPAAHRVVTVFRLGVPAGPLPEPARLPVEELIA